MFLISDLGDLNPRQFPLLGLVYHLDADLTLIGMKVFTYYPNFL
jgi:hypothetical protein